MVYWRRDRRIDANEERELGVRAGCRVDTRTLACGESATAEETRVVRFDNAEELATRPIYRFSAQISL